MATVKTAERQINREVRATYELLLEDEDYAISCKQENRQGVCLEYCCVRDISRCEKRANSIFEAIVKNRVCACTLLDVICDLIC